MQYPPHVEKNEAFPSSLQGHEGQVNKLIPVVKILHTSDSRNEGFLDTLEFLDVTDFGWMPEGTAVFDQASNHRFVQSQHDGLGSGVENT